MHSVRRRSNFKRVLAEGLPIYKIVRVVVDGLTEVLGDLYCENTGIDSVPHVEPARR